MKKLLLSIIISLFLCTGVYAGPWISGGSGSGDVTAASTAQTWGDGTGPVVWTFSVTGTDPTISVATAAFTINTDLALGANDITMTGSLGATGARVTKGWFTDLEVTNAPTINGAAWTTILQPYNAILTAIAGLTPTENAVVGWTTGPTLAALTSHSHSDSAPQFYSATASKGTLKFDQTGISDKKVFTIKAISDADVTFSPGKTWTDGKWCSYATATGLTCNETPGAGTGDLLADGSVKWTAAPEPNAANTIALGSATAEWSDIFLGDGAVINLGNDQDVKITHVADSGIKLEANSEDLTLAATANTWTLSSSTGVDKISLTAMNLVTTGYIDGGIPVTKSTDATITVSGMTGFYVNADDDAIAFNLPADPTNKAFCFANLLYAKAITVNPDDADYIVHAGKTAAAGEAYVSSGARTDQLCVVGIDSSYWLVTSERGTWAEETP